VGEPCQVAATQGNDIRLADETQQVAGSLGPQKGFSAVDVNVGNIEIVARAPNGAEHVTEARDSAQLVGRG
jgi:hypothetical protein